MARQVINLVGKQFGEWRVIRRAETDLNGGAHWACVCGCCGKEHVVRGYHLRTGRSRSCGAATANPELRNIWQGMKRRCLNPEASGYSSYGGRGIRICPEWVDNYLRFLEDVGPRPSPQHSIDRIDPDGHYEPGNVRWATAVMQMNNRRDNQMVEYRGSRMPLGLAVRAAGSKVPLQTARMRIFASGWDVEDALTKPVKKHTKRGAAA